MRDTRTRDSAEYGWQVISRDNYERKVLLECAGKGTPLNPDAPGHWVFGVDSDGSTCLWTGVEIVD